MHKILLAEVSITWQPILWTAVTVSIASYWYSMRGQASRCILILRLFSYISEGNRTVTHIYLILHSTDCQHLTTFFLFRFLARYLTDKPCMPRCPSLVPFWLHCSVKQCLHELQKQSIRTGFFHVTTFIFFRKSINDSVDNVTDMIISTASFIPKNYQLPLTSNFSGLKEIKRFVLLLQSHSILMSTSCSENQFFLAQKIQTLKAEFGSLTKLGTSF